MRHPRVRLVAVTGRGWSAAASLTGGGRIGPARLARPLTRTRSLDVNKLAAEKCPHRWRDSLHLPSAPDLPPQSLRLGFISFYQWISADGDYSYTDVHCHRLITIQLCAVLFSAGALTQGHSAPYLSPHFMGRMKLMSTVAHSGISYLCYFLFLRVISVKWELQGQLWGRIRWYISLYNRSLVSYISN